MNNTECTRKRGQTCWNEKYPSGPSGSWMLRWKSFFVCSSNWSNERNRAGIVDVGWSLVSSFDAFNKFFNASTVIARPFGAKIWDKVPETQTKPIRFYYWMYQSFPNKPHCQWARDFGLFCQIHLSWDVYPTVNLSTLLIRRWSTLTSAIMTRWLWSEFSSSTEVTLNINATVVSDQDDHLWESLNNQLLLQFLLQSLFGCGQYAFKLD